MCRDRNRKILLGTVLLFFATLVSAEGLNITALLNGISGIDSDISVKRRILNDEISQFKARQSVLAESFKKNQEREKRGKAAWAKNTERGKKVFELQEWIKDNLVTESGRVDSAHPTFKRYQQVSAEFKKTKAQLLKEAEEVKSLTKAHVEEAKKLKPKVAAINALKAEVSRLKQLKITEQKKLAEMRTNRTVIIETRILDPDPQPGMKSEQSLGVNFVKKTVSSSYKTGTTDFFGVKLNSVRNNFRVQDVVFHSHDRITLKAVGETGSGVGIIPNINYSFMLELKSDGELKVRGCHDGYPAYKVLVDGSTVYSYRHQAKNLMKLFGECDVSLL